MYGTKRVCVGVIYTTSHATCNQPTVTLIVFSGCVGSIASVEEILITEPTLISTSKSAGDVESNAIVHNSGGSGYSELSVLSGLSGVGSPQVRLAIIFASLQDTHRSVKSSEQLQKESFLQRSCFLARYPPRDNLSLLNKFLVLFIYTSYRVNVYT